MVVHVFIAHLLEGFGAFLDLIFYLIKLPLNHLVHHGRVLHVHNCVLLERELLLKVRRALEVVLLV